MPVSDPVFTAADLLAHRRQAGRAPTGPAPETVLMFFQRDLLSHVKRAHPVEAVKGFYGEVLRLKRGGGRLAVAGGFGVGAAVTAVLAEDLIAFGARQLVSVGLAGGLQPAARPGQVIVVGEALLESGVARLYWPSSRFLQPDHGLQWRLRQALHAAGVSHATGQTWTVDVPYQLSRAAAAEQQVWGTATVEMEVGALLAVGQHRGVPAGAVLVVADTLADGRWQLDANPRPAQRSLRRAADALIAAFA